MDVLGVAVDCGAVDAHREDVAVAIVDGAALGVEGGHVGAIRLGGRGEVGTVDDLKPEEPDGHDPEERRKAAARHRQPSVEVFCACAARARGSLAITRTRGLVIRGLRNVPPPGAAMSVSACHGEESTLRWLPRPSPWLSAQLPHQSGLCR